MIFKMVKPVNIGNVPLETVGMAIHAIREEHDGICPPDAYVERARPPESPTHDSLPWNDRELAESARRDIAGRIIQCVVEVENPIEIQPPLNVSVTLINKSGEIERGYAPVAVVRTCETWETQVEREMLGRIKGELRNHSWLPIAQTLFEYIEQLEKTRQQSKAA